MRYDYLKQYNCGEIITIGSSHAKFHQDLYISLKITSIQIK